ncbi:hypothetical protein [Neobacillus sp. NPDC093127]|uniref:hypothetical protein n=1 Tax=Neobacillus sp. NPDC093127 TaxID=3364296 RepID=UPI0038145ED6
MNKYSVFSIGSLVIFIILFYAMLNRVSLGFSGKLYIISMFLFPLISVIFGLKGQKGFMKWPLIILNIIAICTIGYIMLLAYSIAES